MRRIRTLASLIAAAALLTGCSALHSFSESFQKGYTAGFHKSFRSSFKSSFMASCTQKGAPEKRCDCVESALEHRFSDDQLMKLATSPAETRDALATAARACPTALSS